MTWSSIYRWDFLENYKRLLFINHINMWSWAAEVIFFSFFCLRTRKSGKLSNLGSISGFEFQSHLYCRILCMSSESCWNVILIKKKQNNKTTQQNTWTVSIEWLYVMLEIYLLCCCFSFDMLKRIIWHNRNNSEKLKGGKRDFHLMNKLM